MNTELEKLLYDAKTFKKENQALLKRAKKTNKRNLDQQFHNAHDEAFKKIDCLDCANCCKTTSPIFTGQDIKRLAKLFKMKDVAFINEYLKRDEEDDYVLKSAPCPFLNDDNTCFVYDVRPQACREYPHTNRKNMYQILNLTEKNALVCPAVSSILKQFRAEKQPSK